MATPSSSAATALLPHVDELVLEYLLFRGFTRSFQALAAERKRDRAKGFDVEQITAQLLAFVQNYQLDAILDTWKFLDARFFSRLDASYTATIRQLEDSWLRLYLVNAIKAGHRDKAIEFFKLLADKLNAKGGASSGDSWHRWFILPYVQRPETDAYFRPFFDKQWLELFVTSFRNFLSLIFRNMPLPKLLALQVGRLEEPSLKLRLKTSQSECSRLRLHNAQAGQRIHRLEEAGQTMLRMVETLVQHSFAEHFVENEGFGWSDHIPKESDAASSMGVLKALHTLTSQLRELRDVFGPAGRDGIHRSDPELVAALLDPLEMKLNTVAASTRSGRSDQDAAVAMIGLSSSPSSGSLQSADSNGSPTSDSVTTLQSTLVQEVALPFEPLGDGEGICKYAHDGRRLVVARVGQHVIPVYDVGVDSIVTEREQIRTETAVVGVDWVAHSECLVYALEDGTINVWDTNAQARTFIISYNADERRPSHLACARSRPVGAVALVATETDTTDAPTQAIRIQFFAFEDHAIRVLSSVDIDTTADLLSLDWTSDGSILVVTDRDGRVSLLSRSEAKLMGSWRLGSREAPIAAIRVGPDNQSLVVVNASAPVALEWSIPDLVAASTTDPPPHRASYRLPCDMSDGDKISSRQIALHPSRSTFAVSSSSDSSSTYWTLFTRGHADPILSAPVHATGHINALAWHPVDHTLTATTAETLCTWKLGD